MSIKTKTKTSLKPPSPTYKMYYPSLTTIVFLVSLALILSKNYLWKTSNQITEEQKEISKSKVQFAFNVLVFLIITYILLSVYVFTKFGPSEFLVFNRTVAFVLPYILLFWTLLIVDALTY